MQQLLVKVTSAEPKLPATVVGEQPWRDLARMVDQALELAAEGKGVIVISSEMPELLGISDRIYVMNDGKLVSEMLAKDASQEKIMRAILRADTKPE